LVETGAAGWHHAFRIDGTQPVTTDPAVLAAGMAAETVERVAPAATQPGRFRVRNNGAETFRVADPIEPSALVVRWHPLLEGRVTSEQARALLPIALAVGDTRDVELVLRAPEHAGRYQVEMALADAPQVVIARLLVEVGA
jgi:hypothetical protein